MTERSVPRAAVRSGTHHVVLPQWTRWQRVAAVVGPGLIMASLMTAVLVIGNRSRRAQEWVTHTQAVVDAAQDTRAATLNLETGQRGYLLTLDRAYLTPFADGQRAVAFDTVRLRVLMGDNLPQLRRVDALNGVLRAKHDELTTTIQLANAGKRDSALAIVRTNVGKAYMDSTRALLDAIVTEERRLLDDRVARQRRLQAAARGILVGGTALVVVLAFLTNALLNGAATRHAAQARDLADQARELAEANEQLGEQQAELEMQATQLQTQQAELESTNEHLQEQAAALEAQQAELEMQTEALTRANAELLAAEEQSRASLAAEHAAREAAEQASQAKGQFLSTMSHELRTPLNGIGGYAQLIQLGIHGPVTPEQDAALTRIMKAQQHLLLLINDILNLSRIEAGKLEYDVRETTIADVVSDVVPMIEPQVAARRMTLTVDVPSPVPVVWADRDRLRQVMLNLLSNATKFTPEGGSIAIAVAPLPDVEDRIALTVRDTGYGIPSAKRDTIFEPFVQLHRQLTDRDGMSLQGTGLGLAISRDLMRGMGGDITVASEEGNGSTFTVVLRLVRTPEGNATDRRTHDERRTDDERRSGEDRREEHDEVLVE